MLHFVLEPIHFLSALYLHPYYFLICVISLPNFLAPAPNSCNLATSEHPSYPHYPSIELDSIKIFEVSQYFGWQGFAKTKEATPIFIIKMTLTVMWLRIN